MQMPMCAGSYRLPYRLRSDVSAVLQLAQTEYENLSPNLYSGQEMSTASTDANADVRWKLSPSISVEIGSQRCFTTGADRIRELIAEPVFGAGNEHRVH